MNELSSSLFSWRNERLSSKPMTVTEVSFASCEPWQFDGNILRRPDGRFFQGALSASQAWILQPEVGTLGFLTVMNRDTTEILLQLKEEPGNVGVTQIAPSVQATQSNWERVHGGPAQPYIDFFQNKRADSEVLKSVVNSEQGTRFWRKRNRNIVVRVRHAVEEDVSHRWFPVEQVRWALGQSFLVNTDARSVLAGADWRSVVPDGSVGRRAEDHVGLEKLQTSIRKNDRTQNGALELLADVRRRGPEGSFHYLSPISREVTEDRRFWGLNGSGFRCVQVTSRFRELSEWSQPLYSTAERWTHHLVVSEIAGRVSILLRICEEPGLYNGPEWGPSASIATHSPETGVGGLRAEIAAQLDSVGVTLREIDQSDEGGRFFHEVSTYKLMWVDATELENGTPLSMTLLGYGYCWVSPLVLNDLCGVAMTTTNELRTLASLVIS